MGHFRKNVLQTAHAPNFDFGQDVAKSKDARRVREP